MSDFSPETLAREIEARCPNGVCGSVHDADAYNEGWLIVGTADDGYTIEHVVGEKEIHDFANKDRAKLQIFWTEEGAKDEYARLTGSYVTHPITGSLLKDMNGDYVPKPEIGLITFNPNTGVIVDMSAPESGGK